MNVFIVVLIMSRPGCASIFNSFGFVFVVEGGPDSAWLMSRGAVVR